MIGIGCVLWVATMLGVAFSTKLWHFMLTQGVMQGIAGGFVFPVCVCVIFIRDFTIWLTRAIVCISFPMVPQESWLLDRHSLVGELLRYEHGTSAYRNTCADLSLGAAATSAIIREMLSRFGLRKTMLIKTGVDAIVLGAAYLLIKERRKPSKTVIWYDKKFLTDLSFWSITMCMCLANLGYPAPFFYLPTFAKQKIPNLSELVSI